MRYIVTYKANKVDDNTLKGLKELSKLGLFEIIDVRNHTFDEWWCETEGYEMYDESFIVDIEFNRKVYGDCGANVLSTMFFNTFEYVGVKLIKDEI